MIELWHCPDARSFRPLWALEELGHLAGAVYTDDLLDRVFSRFCIGK